MSNMASTPRFVSLTSRKRYFRFIVYPRCESCGHWCLLKASDMHLKVAATYGRKVIPHDDVHGSCAKWRKHQTSGHCNINETSDIYSCTIQRHLLACYRKWPIYGFGVPFKMGPWNWTLKWDAQLGYHTKRFSRPAQLSHPTEGRDRSPVLSRTGQLRMEERLDWAGTENTQERKDRRWGEESCCEFARTWLWLWRVLRPSFSCNCLTGNVSGQKIET